jgi:hypothetical protein
MTSVAPCHESCLSTDGCGRVSDPTIGRWELTGIAAEQVAYQDPAIGAGDGYVKITTA